MIALPLFAAFLSPPYYSFAMLALAGIFVLHSGFARQDQIAPNILTIIAVWFAFAALAVLGPTFVSAYATRNVDSFKFFIAGFSFLVGALLGRDEKGFTIAFPAFLAAMCLVYATGAPTNDLGQDRTFYPPDPNHSAAMLSLSLPFILFKFRGWRRLAIIGLMMVFAYLVASRALLALSVVTLAAAPEFIRNRKWVMLLAIPAALAILLFQGFSLNNFSDQLRLQILQISYDFGITRGFYAFNLGETYFTNFLNINPIYRQLEIQHAHNILLQIWVAYGLVPLGVFVAWLALLARHAWQSRYGLFALQLAILMMFGMIESVITDIRSFGTITLLLGVGYAQAGSALAARQAKAAAGRSGTAPAVGATPQDAPRGRRVTAPRR